MTTSTFRPPIPPSRFLPPASQAPAAPERANMAFWWPVIGLTLVTLALIVVHQTRVLQLAFPVMSFAIACYFYRRFPVQFVGYMWWIWFLTPEVRRLGDFMQGSFTDFSLIMVAPIMVSGLTVLTMLRRYRYLGTQGGLPLVMVLLGLAYGYAVGILNGGLAPATFALASWLLPVTIAYYLITHWRLYPAMRRCLIRTFTVGTILCGAYGLIQYVFMPPWDAAWMVWSDMTTSMGNPVPFQVRVFGPLNSLAPFTAVICAGILLATVEKNRGRFMSAVFGILSLALSFVRSAWGGIVISFLYQMIFFNNRARLRVLVSVLVIAAATVPVLMSGQVADSLGKRLQSITDLKDDSSFSDRSSFYSSFLDTAVTNIGGIGLGATGLSSKLSSGPDSQKFASFDSGLMEVPFVLGWPGALLYMTGIVWLMINAAKAARRLRNDRYVVAWFSITLGTVAQMIFGNSLINISGQLALMGMLIPIMALRYYADASNRAAQARRAAQLGVATANAGLPGMPDIGGMYGPASAHPSRPRFPLTGGRAHPLARGAKR